MTRAEQVLAQIMNALLERLREHWQSQNLQVGSGASEEEVVAFERAHGVALPPLLREYVRELNGLANCDCDADLIFFWPLGRIEGEVRDWSGRYGDQGRNCFVFADWSISCHDFVIRLSPDPEAPAPAFVTYHSLQPIAASFREFIERYLEGDPDLLYPKLQVLESGNDGRQES